MDITRFYFVHKDPFQFLNEEETGMLNKSISQKIYKKGKDVFLEGTSPKGVYILDKGKLKIFQKTMEGSQQIINIHVPGEIVGYRPLLCDEKYPVTATAIEDCLISFIPKKAFLDMLRSSSALSNTLLKFLSYEFTVWVNTISNLKHRTVKERLLLNLLILIEKYRTKKKWPVEITLSRADLAALVGTSNETLARLLTLLKIEKHIATKGRTLLIHNSAQADKIRKSLQVF